MNNLIQTLQQRLINNKTIAKKLTATCLIATMLANATSCDMSDLTKSISKMFKSSEETQSIQKEVIREEEAVEKLKEIANTKFTCEIYNTIYKSNGLLNENNIVDNVKLNDYLTNDYVSAPLTFLEKQGYDIDEVLSGRLDCDTRCFVLDDQPNSLYMATCLKNGEEDFGYELYGHYLLRYDLTERDMAEFKLLCSDNNRAHIESLFMPEIISNMYEPTVLVEQKALVGILSAYPNGSIAEKNYKLESLLERITSSTAPYFEAFGGEFPKDILYDQLSDYMGHKTIYILPVSGKSVYHNKEDGLDLTVNGYLSRILAFDNVKFVDNVVTELEYPKIESYDKHVKSGRDFFKQYPVTVYTLPGAKYASEYKDYIYGESPTELGFWFDKESARAMENMSTKVSVNQYTPEL